MYFSDLERMVKKCREFLDSKGIEDDCLEIVNEGNLKGSLDLYSDEFEGFIRTVLKID